MRPVGWMMALMPVLTLRTIATRFSTARNTHRFRCWSSSYDPLNQPSLEMLTRKSTAFRVTRPVRAGMTAPSSSGRTISRIRYAMASS